MILVKLQSTAVGLKTENFEICFKKTTGFAKYNMCASNTSYEKPYYGHFSRGQSIRSDVVDNNDHHHITDNKRLKYNDSQVKLILLFAYKNRMRY